MQFQEGAVARLEERSTHVMWRSPVIAREVQRYTDDADRKRLATIAKRGDRSENSELANLGPWSGKRCV